MRTGVRCVDADDEVRLFPEETRTVASAAPSRRREFATGRVLLRQLLERDVVIPIAPGGRPLLPDGVLASLSHDRQIAVAVMSQDRRVVALGVDIEPVDSFTPELAPHILREDDELTDAAMAFVVKEAAYKAWSTHERPILDHHDVHLALAGDASIVATVLPTGHSIPVQAVLVAGRWLALAVAAV